MYYKELKIKDLLDGKDGGKQVIDLLADDISRYKLIYLKKGESFDSLILRGNVCIHIIKGHLKISFPDEESCGCSGCFCTEDSRYGNKREFIVKAGSFFMFKKDIKHTAEALKDCIFTAAVI